MFLEIRFWFEEEEEMKWEGKEKEVWKEIFLKWIFYYYGVLFFFVFEFSFYFILFIVVVYGVFVVVVVLDCRWLVVWVCGMIMFGVVEVLDGYVC